MSDALSFGSEIAHSEYFQIVTTAHNQLLSGIGTTGTYVLLLAIFLSPTLKDIQEKITPCIMLDRENAKCVYA